MQQADMKVSIPVYIGETWNVEIHRSVIAQAIEANQGKPLSDKRTKGAKLMQRWARQQVKQVWER